MACDEESEPAASDGPLPDAVAHKDLAAPDIAAAPDTTTTQDLSPPDQPVAKPDLPASKPDVWVPFQCKKHCDCQQGYDCKGNYCVAVKPPKYCCTNKGCPTGQTCYDAQGKKSICGGLPPLPCKSRCSCTQGYDCLNNTCTKTTPPVYCCTKTGCPVGSACRYSNGTAGTCPSVGACKRTCDCVQGLVCSSGACTKSPSGPVYCCSKPNCPAGKACVDTAGKAGTCSTTSKCAGRCDCAQGYDCVKGACAKVTPPAYCCSKSGCPAGSACRYKNGAGSTCPSTGACKVNCDCHQALTCVSGACTKGLGGPAYCCSRPGCPTGSSCTDSSGKTGTCP